MTHIPMIHVYLWRFNGWQNETEWYGAFTSQETASWFARIIVTPAGYKGWTTADQEGRVTDRGVTLSP